MYKKKLILIFLLLFLYSCNNENVSNNNPSSNSNSIPNNTKVVEEKDLLETKFNTIRVLQEKWEIGKLKKILDDLYEQRKSNNVVNDFFENTDIGKSYILWNIGEEKLEWFFSSLKNDFESWNYEKVKKQIDELVAVYKNNKSFKEFLEKSEVWIWYVTWEIKWDELWIRYKNIISNYELWNYEKVRKEINDIKTKYKDNKWLEDFLKNSEVWVWFTTWKLVKDELGFSIKKLMINYDKWDYENVKNEIDRLKENYSDNQWFIEFLNNSEAWVWYTTWKKVTDELWDKLKMIVEKYESWDFDSVKYELDKLKENYSDNKWYIEFINTSEVWKWYITWEKVWTIKEDGDELWEKLKVIVDLFDRGKEQELIKEIELLLTKYPENNWLKEFLKYSEAWIWYNSQNK